MNDYKYNVRLIKSIIVEYNGEYNKELYENIKYNMIMFFKNRLSNIDEYNVRAFTECILEGTLQLKPIEWSVVNQYKDIKENKQIKIRNKEIIIGSEVYKQCTQCCKLLPIDNFYYNDSKKNIRKGKCKKCIGEYYKDNSTLKKAYQLEYYHNKKEVAYNGRK